MALKVVAWVPAGLLLHCRPPQGAEIKYMQSRCWTREGLAEAPEARRTLAQQNARPGDIVKQLNGGEAPYYEQKCKGARPALPMGRSGRAGPDTVSRRRKRGAVCEQKRGCAVP